MCTFGLTRHPLYAQVPNKRHSGFFAPIDVFQST